MVAAVVKPTHFYPQQHDFLLDRHKWSAFVGGRGSGKTHTGAWKALERACRPDPGVGVIAAPDFPMLEFGAKRQFIQRLRDAGIGYELNKSTGVLTVPRTGAEVRFATLDNESRIRGPNYSWGWADELDYLADFELWQALKGAIRAGDHPQLFATSTPKGRRLIWREWVESATADHALYRASTLDNPYIDATGYVAALGYAGRFYKQEIEAGFEGAEGLVYDGWDRERVREVDTAGWRRILGVDVGTRNPTAILTVAVAGDGRQHIARERYQRNLAASEVVAEVRHRADLEQVEAIVIDPSAAGYVRDLELLGYPVVKADNDRKRGVQLCTTALADGLTVDPSCVNFIAEIESYAYPDGGRGDDPVKEMDHCLIAGTLVETEHGPRPIEMIRAGDLVMTHGGLRPVVAAGMTNPSAQVHTMRAGDGRTLTGSAAHPVWTEQNGWISLDALRYGDILYVWQASPNPSSSTASRSDATPTRRVGRSSPISRRTAATAGEASGDCTRKSGRRPTAQSHWVARFTIATETRSTIPSTISNASHVTSIAPRTKGNRRANASGRTSKPSARPRRHGIVPRKGERGIGRTVGMRGLTALRLSVCVTTAARRSLRPAHNRAFAPTSAGRHLAAPVASMTRTAFAASAAPYSASTAIAAPAFARLPVLSVTAEPQKQPVYNLTVADIPEFIANGVLVHNCMDAWRYVTVYVAEPEPEPMIWA